MHIQSWCIIWYARAVNMLYARVCSAAYDWSSGRYSTWTESRWAGDAINVRYFLVPPTSLEVRQSSTPLQLRKRTRHVTSLITWQNIFMIDSCKLSEIDISQFEKFFRHVFVKVISIIAGVFTCIKLGQLEILGTCCDFHGWWYSYILYPEIPRRILWCVSITHKMDVLQVSTLMAGIVMILITWPLGYLLHKRASLLFEPSSTRYVW